MVFPCILRDTMLPPTFFKGILWISQGKRHIWAFSLLGVIKIGQDTPGTNILHVLTNWQDAGATASIWLQAALLKWMWPPWAASCKDLHKSSNPQAAWVISAGAWYAKGRDETNAFIGVRLWEKLMGNIFWNNKHCKTWRREGQKQRHGGRLPSHPQFNAASRKIFPIYLSRFTRLSSGSRKPQHWSRGYGGRGMRWYFVIGRKDFEVYVNMFSH